jgi:WD40 repeat protein
MSTLLHSRQTANASSRALDDKTIRVWDAETGAVVSGPFEGHELPRHSVAFSPGWQARCLGL